MKLLRYCIFLISVLWMAQEVAKDYFPLLELTSIEAAMDGEEKTEQKEETEIQEFNLPYHSFEILSEKDLPEIFEIILYKTPLLLAPEVPPESHS